MNLVEILANLPCVQTEKIQELKELDVTGSVFDQLVNIFKNESLNRIPEMKKFAASEDFTGLGKVTHRFRSTAFNLGALRAAELTKQIDLTIARTPVNKSELEPLINSLERECQAAYNKLNSFKAAA